MLFSVYSFNLGSVVRQVNVFNSIEEAQSFINSVKPLAWQIDTTGPMGKSFMTMETLNYGHYFMAFKTFLRHYCRHTHPQAYR